MRIRQQLSRLVDEDVACGGRDFWCQFERPGVTSMIEIKKTQIYRGPNIWARMPVILFTTDIGELEDRPTNKIPGFYEKLKIGRAHV